MKLEMNGCVYVVIFGLCLLSLPVVNVYRTLHPTPEKLTTYYEIGDKVGLWFPPGTTAVEGGYVDESGTFYPAVYAYGVVTVPKSQLGQLNKHTTMIPKSQADIKKCRDWILQAPKDFNFSDTNWKASRAKNYQVLYNAGGAVLIDLDNSTTATVYIRSG